jgi:hypothetical protein
MNFFQFCREGMTRICLAQAASSQTLGTILTALRNGSLLEACSATRRWTFFFLPRWQLCRNFEAAGNGWWLEQIKQLMARDICLHNQRQQEETRRDWRDGSHGRRFAPSWLWSLEGLTDGFTLIIRDGGLVSVHDSICYGEEFDHSLDNK